MKIRTRRKSPCAKYPRVSRSISFVGEDGYDMLDFFDSEGGYFEYGKSGLVIELLKLYKEALGMYGRKEAILKMRMCIELDKEKER